MEWVGIDEAAKRTGEDKGTLRKRAQRGAPGTRKGKAGRWEFELPVQDEVDVVQDAHEMRMEDAYRLAIKMQREHIEDLQLQLDRKDAQINNLLTRVPELEAPTEPERRPWWRRIVG